MSYINGLNLWFERWEYWIYAGIVLMMIAAYGLGLLLDRFKQSLHGDAGFSDAYEIKAAGLNGNGGIVLGEYRGKVLRFGGSQHVALMSPTRSGKGVSVVTPTMLTWHDSVVAFDVKDELFRQSSRYREQCGQPVWKFAPFSLTTHQQNPLDYISDDPMQRVASIQTIAYILYPSQAKDSMWTDNARALFVAMVLLVLESDDMPGTIGEVFRLSGGYGQPLQTHLHGLIMHRNFNKFVTVDGAGVESVEYVKKPPYDGVGVPPLSDVCVDGLNKYINAPKDTAGGILTNLQAPLQLWASEVVDAATSASSFDLRTLRQQRQSLYIHVPPNKIGQSGVLLRLLFSQIISLNSDELRGVGHPYQLLLALDEFATLGHMSIIEESIGYLAGYGIRLLLICQSKGQIARSVFEGGYGREGATNILDNCAATIYFTPKKSDSEELSQLLGTRTVKARSVQIRNRWQGSESEQRRELMLPQELRAMSQKLAILDIDGVRPIKCRKVTWYKNPAFRNRLWSISPALKGIKSPSEDQLEAAASDLCSFVPTLDRAAWLGAKSTRAAAMTAPEVVSATIDDVAGGIELDQLAFNMPETSAGTMTEQQRVSYVDAFFSELTGDEDTGEIIDTETGEVTTTIDMSLLDVA